MWVPYYFIRIGFGSASSIVTIFFLFALTFGLFPTEFLFRFCKCWSEFFICLMLILNLLVLFLLMLAQHSSSSLAFYLVMFGTSGFLISQAYSRTMGSDPVALAENDEKTRYLMVLCSKVMRQIFLLVSMIIIGRLMEDNVENIFGAILVSSFIFTFFHVIRKIMGSSPTNPND